MSERSLRLLDSIHRRLIAARWRVALAEAGFGALVTIALAMGLLGIFAAAEALVWFGSGVRWFLVAVFAASVFSAFAVLVAAPLLRGARVLPGLDDAAVARIIGRRYPEVADRLSNLLDLAGGRGSASSAGLVDGAIQMLGAQVGRYPIECAEDRERIRRTAPLAATPVLGVLVALLLVPGLGPAVDRLFSPTSSFDPPAPFALTVEPGDVELVRGGDLEVEVRAVGGSYPRLVTLEMRRDGEERIEQIRIAMGDEGAFRHVESSVRTGLRYRATAEGVTSAWYRAAVVSRPMIEGLQVILRPPSYTRLPPQRLGEGVGDVVALPGTTVEVGLRVDGPGVAEAKLVFESGHAVPMDVRGRQAAGRFAVRRADAYRIRLVSTEGHENPSPITYDIRPLTDEPPQIRLLEPHDGTLTESLVTRVRARVTDDFGFSRAILFYRLSERDGSSVDSEFAELSISIRPDELDQDITREWLLGATGLDLRPGDVVAYYVQVWDNNSVAGYQSARTATHFLRFPSITEQLDRLDEAEDATREGLDDLRRDADDARRRFEDLRDDLMRRQEADWEDQRQLERLMDQHQRLEDRVQESVQQMQDVIDQMREHQLISEETREMYEQLQRVIEEIADPDLLEQLRQLQEAMQEMNFEQMLRSMDQFDFDERAFRERLERALELFERLRTAKELEEAARRAEDIAEQEQRLEEQTGELEDAAGGGELTPEEQQAEQERLAEQQRQAQEAAEALREQLEQLQERLQEQRGGQEMSNDLQQMQQQVQEAMEQMQENMQQLQDGALQDAQQGQQQLQQQMQQMQQMLEMMGQQMSGQQQQRSVAGLRRAIDNVLTLSFEQEGLRDRAAAQRPESPVLRQNAQQQVELAAGLSTVTDSLRVLAREVPQMERAIQDRAGNALRLMGEATESLADRQPPQAVSHQKGAMTSLNDLAVLLVDLLDQMMDGAGGAGAEMSLQQMLQQLQQMSGDQQMLNEQIQQMLNDMQGQRLSIDQEGRLQQMRQQQEAIRQQLEELIQQPNLDAQTRSQLQRIAEEMEDVARKMDGGRLDRDLRDQQENILTRLLEAHESLNERGRKEEREGTPADERQRHTDTPETSPEQEEIDRLRRDLIRALESDFTPDYQELIRRYFELLQQRTRE